MKTYITPSIQAEKDLNHLFLVAERVVSVQKKRNQNDGVNKMRRVSTAPIWGKVVPPLLVHLLKNYVFVGMKFNILTALKEIKQHHNKC